MRLVSLSRPPGKSPAERQAEYRRRHPERAAQSRNRARFKKKTQLDEIKAERGCERCGIRDSRVLDLHHRDPAQKLLAVSQIVSRYGWQAVLDEVDKCVVLCANCHRIIHYEERPLVDTEQRLFEIA